MSSHSCSPPSSPPFPSLLPLPPLSPSFPSIPFTILYLLPISLQHHSYPIDITPYCMCACIILCVSGVSLSKFFWRVCVLLCVPLAAPYVCLPRFLCRFCLIASGYARWILYSVITLLRSHNMLMIC